MRRHTLGTGLSKEATLRRHLEFARLYWKENLTLREIGERFGVSRQAVQDALKKLGVERRSGSGWNRGQTQFERLKGSIDLGELVRRYTEEFVPMYVLAR